MPPRGGNVTPLAQQAAAQSFIGRAGAAARFLITGVTPSTWFGPSQPLPPIAPPDVKGRQFDYPVGINIQYAPRSTEPVSFFQMRQLADAVPLLRAVIETRKDQIAGLEYMVRPRVASPAACKKVSRIDDPASKRVAEFLRRPDQRHSFAHWLRMMIEEMLVTDAVTIYPRMTVGGSPFSMDLIDGATIKPLIGDDGRSPMPPDPAFQQIIKGVPAADFTLQELIYAPRNTRVYSLGYGYSPVEQVMLTANIALRRDLSTLEYYKTGSIPDAFGTLPKEWTSDQVRQFQDYFDAMLAGNLADRRRMKFMPGDFKMIETHAPPLKDQYDEWLARIVCYVFSVPISPFVNQVNRATGETLKLQASQEGMTPLKRWLKDLLDRIIHEYLGEKDVEFAFDDSDENDPLEQAQTLIALVGAGIKNRDEARDDLGLEAMKDGEGAEYNITTGHGLEPTTIPPEPDPLAPTAPGATTPRNPNAGPMRSTGASAGPVASKPPKPNATKNAGGRTLYVHRALTNGLQLVEWAKANGFRTTLPTDDMHATVAFSRAPIDWNSAPTDPIKSIMAEGGARALARFGQAVVLKFDCPHLATRNEEFGDAGASWDHPSYQPHVTLSYDADDLDLDAIEPYTGPLDFGPEVWGEVKEDWNSGIAEKSAAAA